MNRFHRFALGAGMVALAGCTTIPSGPSEMSLPGTGKSFDQFRADDGECRRFALAQVDDKTRSDVQVESGVKSAAVGAGVGAIAGAAVGGGHGAATGAGLGLVVGAVAGADAGDRSSWGLQRRYDAAYKQCMFARGHKIPVYGNLATQPAARAPAPLAPPPPPGR